MSINPTCTSSQQRITGSTVPLRSTSLLGQVLQVCSDHTSSTAASKTKPKSSTTGLFGKTAHLVKLGFTEEQAARVLSFFVRRKVTLNDENIQPWLMLLQKYNVEDAMHVVSQHPMILTSRASTADANADGVMTWMQTLGVTHDQRAALLGKYPVLLNVPNTTQSATSAWLGSELGWSSTLRMNVLMKVPELFGLSCQNLDAKLAWFLANGISTELIKRKPHLLLFNMSSSINKTKIYFLTQIMKQELQACMPCVTYSLFHRIGPRWAFHTLHCKDQPFTLSYRLDTADADFVHELGSSSFEAECATRNLTRIDVYEDFRARWQQGEGEGVGSREETKIQER